MSKELTTEEARRCVAEGIPIQLKDGDGVWRDSIAKLPEDVIPNWPYRIAKGETILQEAQRLVYGERGVAYGHPRDDFSRAADIFNAISGEVVLDAVDIAYVLLAVKLSRQQNKGKRDNLVDAAGYLACLARVEGWDI